jgi:cytochrome c oxidase subunit I
MVWGHHMFMSGMSPYSAFAFSMLTMCIGVPSAIKTFNWLGTMWKGQIRFQTPMLYAIGFVSLFVSGGLSGRSWRSRCSIFICTTLISWSATFI